MLADGGELHTIPPMSLPDFSVAGRVVLITGAGRGIGLAIAKSLAAGGAKVVIQDIDEAVARAEVDAITSAGGQALALGGDLTDLTLPERLVDAVTAAFGPVEILINNGSIQAYRPFLEHTLEQMQQELNANVLAAVRLCQLTLPTMQKAGWGRVINFGSIQGLGGNDHMPIYALSRAGMSNFTSGLAKRYGRDGITVNCVAPGWTHTQRTEVNFPSEEKKAENGKWIPLRRVGEPEDYVGVIHLLCSHAGEYITGQTLHVDGGMSLK